MDPRSPLNVWKRHSLTCSWSIWIFTWSVYRPIFMTSNLSLAFNVHLLSDAFSLSSLPSSDDCFSMDRTDVDGAFFPHLQIHWPVPLNKGYTWPLQPHMFDTTRSIKEDTKETWQAMEKIAESGKARSIGVSNFSAKKLEDMMEYAKVVPAVNQVECHPMWRQDKLRAYMKTHNIHLSVWTLVLAHL